MKLVVSLLIALALCACGGGGSSGSSSSPQPNHPPVANAGMAKSVLVGTLAALDGSSSADPEGGLLSYRWELNTKPAASKAVFADGSAVKPSFTPDVAGTYVATLTVNDGAQNSAPSTVSITAVAANAVEIKADKAEPLTGTVKLSLSVSTEGAIVNWRRGGFLDLGQGATIGLDTGGPGTTVGLTNGLHQIEAELVVAGTSTRITRKFYVRHDVLMAYVDYAGDETILTVYAPTGTASVSASLENVALGTLSAPNVCDDYCPSGFNLHQFRIDNAKVGPGKHQATVIAIDGNGKSQSIAVSVPISAPPNPNPVIPSVDLRMPVHGGFVYGQLQLSGTTAGAAGPLTFTAHLDGIQVFQTTDRNFSAVVDVSRLAPGAHTLVYKVEGGGGSFSSFRNVLVVSQPSLAYSPVFAFGGTGALLAASGKQIVYGIDNQSVNLRDLGSGDERRLWGGTVGNTDQLLAGEWQFGEQGEVVGRARLPGCPAYYEGQCVYLWKRDGTVVNLTDRADANLPRAPMAVRTRSGHVVTLNTYSKATIYNIATGTSRTVSVPDLPRYECTNFDFVVRDGVTYLYEYAFYGNSPKGNDPADLFAWRSDTNTFVQVTQGGTGGPAVIRGDHVAWIQDQSAGGYSSYSLVSMPLAGGTQTVLATNAFGPRYRDGLLVFRDHVRSDSNNTFNLKVMSSTGSVTTLLENQLESLSLLTTGGGFVVYGTGGKIYSWNAATGETTLRLDSLPAQLLLTEDMMYFVMKDQQLLHAVRLK